MSNLIRTTADTITDTEGIAWQTVSVSTRDSLFQQTVELRGDDFNWTQAAAVLCKSLAIAQDVATRVPAGRQQAFATTVLNSMSYHCHATSALVLVQAAAFAYAHKDNQMARTNLEQAVPHLDDIAQSLRQAEVG